MNFRKTDVFFFSGKSCSRDFGGPACHPSTLFDLAITALASKSTVKAICIFSEGYRTHRGVTGPMNFKKKKIRTFFIGNSCSKDFGDPGCHPSTLIDLANTAVARKSSVKTICMISSGYRTHRGDTGPMNFKKSGGFFSETRTRGILCTVCHPSTIIDLAITALASRGIVKTICMISEGYRANRGVRVR